MSPLRRALASVAAVGVGLAATITAGTAASAGPPPTPAEEFYAEPCIGDTFDDPTQAMDLEDGRGIPVPDLTRVWGPRLDDYNAGKPVVLYDTFGSNDIDGFPPVCMVRHVDGVGPVSEWAFCTNIWYHTCSGTDAEGHLLDYDGVQIRGLEPRTGNDAMSVDDEKIVAWLVQHGHEYTGFGEYDLGGSPSRRSTWTARSAPPCRSSSGASRTRRRPTPATRASGNGTPRARRAWTPRSRPASSRSSPTTR